MSKPLPSQNAFAGLAPPWSLANLDSNFTNVWNAIDDIGTYSLYVIDTGVVNALQVTISAPLTVSLVDGLTLDIKVANTITSGTPTLQVNALGAKTITNGDGTGLQPNQLVVGGIYRLIYSASANAWVLVGYSLGSFNQVRTKLASTSRANTVVLANDPDLQVNLTATGIYTYEVYLSCNTPGATGGTPGILFTLACSGTLDPAAANYTLFSGVTQNSVAPSIVAFGSAASEPLVGGSVVSNTLIFKGGIKTSTAGLFSLQWAQNLTSANATIVQAGSYMVVKRLA